jgi:aminodeoxyfutalosine synthase
MSETTLLDPVLERLQAGQPVSAADRTAVMAATDILSLGMAADAVRRRLHGDRVTFLRVDAVALTASAPVDGLSAAAGEIRVDGRLDDQAVLKRLEAIVEAAPESVPVSGFSLAEIERVSGGDRQRARGLLGALAAAGLTTIAEAPIDLLEEASAMVALACDAGLDVARVTIQHPLGGPERLLDLAGPLFEADPRLSTFAPLPRTFENGAPTTGYEDVRTVALARLLLPVAHIQVSWSLYGPKLAQVALAFGADDVDEVSPLDEGPEGKRRAPLAEILRNIEAAGGRPVERDGRFGVRS